MRKIRVLLAVTLMLSIVFTQSIFADTIFPDVAENAWYADHVAAVAEAGIIIGNSQGEFMPAGTLNADQFIKTMVVAVGHDVGNGDRYWASKYIDKARALNIIDENEFNTQVISSQPITRAQMAKVIQRVLYYLEGEYTYTKKDAIMAYIPDITDVMGSGYEEYIFQVYERGIITGDSNGNFKPNATVTRAEASAVLHRIIDNSVRRPFVEPSLNTGVIYDTKEFDDNTYYGMYIDVTYNLPTQYKLLNDFISPYVSESTRRAIEDYVRTKTDFEEILESIFWEEGNAKIRVSSDWLEDYIIVDLWVYK